MLGSPGGIQPSKQPVLLSAVGRERPNARKAESYRVLCNKQGADGAHCKNAQLQANMQELWGVEVHSLREPHSP